MKKSESRADCNLPWQLASRETCSRLLLEIDERLAGIVDSDTPVSDEMLQLLSANGLASSAKTNLTELSRCLSQTTRHRSYLKITTATPLTVESQQSILQWVDRNIGNNQILVSFITDSSVIGGAIIQTPTKRLDYTIDGNSSSGRQRIAAMVAA